MIPEKWKIMRTHDNYEILNKWNMQHPLFKKQKRGESFHIPSVKCVNGDWFYSDRAHGCKDFTEYTEITLEEFKEYCLDYSYLNKTAIYEIY